MPEPQRRIGEIVDNFHQQIGTRQLKVDKNFDTSQTNAHLGAKGKSLRLFLPYGGEPIALNQSERMQIGRKDPFGTFAPAIDLTNSHGANLGVSRHHADILFMNDSYYIKDMGSTNGTWVNGQKLAPHQITPIRYGDSLRLGHLVLAVG